MPAEVRQLDLVLKLRDQASKKMKGFSLELGVIKKASVAATAGLAGLTAGFAAAGVAAVKSASDYEQSRISFETMLGSAEEAKKLLKDISDFAVKTPFELPGVVEGAKKLLAYNIEADKLLPTLESLGNIAAGVGQDKLPNLILAFGQVKAATKLTGMELRQFTEAGVPMLSLLADLGKEGKLMSQSQGSIKITTKGSSREISNLNDRLKIAKQRLKEVKKNGDAKKSTILSAKLAVKKYSQQLGEASKKVGGLGDASKITEAQIKEMVTDGVIKFEDVERALNNATGEGGKFFKLMERQSKTFSGIMSNIKDDVGRFGREIVGISEEGDIKEGGLFFHLKNGAEGLLSFLEHNREKIINTFNVQIEKAIEAVNNWVESVGGPEGIKNKLIDLWNTLRNDVAPAIVSLIKIASGAIKVIWDWKEVIIATYIALRTLQLIIAGAQMISAIVTFTQTVAASTTAVGFLKLALLSIPTAIVISLAILGVVKVVDAIKEINAGIDDMQKNVDKMSGQAQILLKKREEAKSAGDTERAEMLKQQIINISKGIGTIGNIRTVQDAVISPGGDIITTDPKDFLIATKKPGELAGGGVNVNINGGMYLDRNAGEQLAEALSVHLRTKLRI